MYGDFRWRQSENQPSVANIHICELEHIAQKSSVSLRINAVND
jgi:hypothetical protein